MKLWFSELLKQPRDSIFRVHADNRLSAALYSTLTRWMFQNARCGAPAARECSISVRLTCDAV